MQKILKKYHFLVAGRVTFRDRENPDQLGSLDKNTTLVLDEKNVTAKNIGQAQQALQMLVFRSFDEQVLERVEVTDVIILSVSYLGQMTQERFLAGVGEQAEAPAEPAVPADVSKLFN